MAKTKIVDKNALSQYTEEMKGYIKSQGLGLTEEDINGLIDIKLVPVNETIENKVDKVDGMGLSTNDYTNEDKSTLLKINEDYLTSIDKTELNSTIEKAKQEAITTVLGETVDTDFDTLQEVADWIQADTTNSVQLVTRVSESEENIKSLEDNLSTHKTDMSSHVTSTERTTWNTVSNKVDKVNGKGLSSNDYTNEDKLQVETNKSDILSLQEDVEKLNSISSITTDAIDSLFSS